MGVDITPKSLAQGTLQWHSQRLNPLFYQVDPTSNKLNSKVIFWRHYYAYWSFVSSSLTCLTISSLSRGRKLRASPLASRTQEHLERDEGRKGVEDQGWWVEHLLFLAFKPIPPFASILFTPPIVTPDHLCLPHPPPPLTSSAWSQRLLYCRGGMSRQAAWSLYSWIYALSWMYTPEREGGRAGHVIQNRTDISLATNPALSELDGVLDGLPLYQCNKQWCWLIFNV